MRNVMIVIVALALGLLVVGEAPSTHAVPAQSSNLPGDANCDAYTTASDTLAILDHVAVIGPDAPCLDVANVFCDNAVTIADGMAILRWVAGLDPNLPGRCLKIGLPPRPSPVSTGSDRVRGTYEYDFDAGRMSATPSDPSMDAFWEIETDTTRQLVPENGAQFALLPNADFETLNFTEVAEASFSSDPIDASDANDHLPAGAVIAVRTSSGNYAKVRVTSIAPYPDDTMYFDWVTVSLSQ
jgi:hypothetical protein